MLEKAKGSHAGKGVSNFSSVIGGGVHGVRAVMGLGREGNDLGGEIYVLWRCGACCGWMLVGCAGDVGLGVRGTSGWDAWDGRER